MLLKLLLIISVLGFLEVFAGSPQKEPTQALCRGKKIQTPKQFTPRSCLDYLKNGYESNGYYKIYMSDKKTSFVVYCDMCSETGAAWTLIESFALENVKMKEFKVHPFKTNAPVNENSPNWNLYRMSLSKMSSIRTQATHWRATCSFPTHGVDYNDYVRAKLAEFDIMTFLGHGVCKKVEFVSIRGHRCTHCTSKWWQILNTYGPHIDSPSTGCQFIPKKGAVSSEDNFGYYGSINNKFRCTSSPTSTTNWWLGGYQ